MQIDPARSNRDEIGQMLLDENATSTGPGHSFPRGVAEPLFSSVCHARQHRAWRRADGHLAVAEILSSSPSLAVSRGRSVIGRGPTGQPTPAPDCAGQDSGYGGPCRIILLKDALPLPVWTHSSRTQVALLHGGGQACDRLLRGVAPALRLMDDRGRHLSGA